jgi:P27 family predicted phage terminase small subunit
MLERRSAIRLKPETRKMRGRKPTPTQLRRLRGNPGRRPLPANEAEAPVSDKVPRPPARLKAEARQEWCRIAPLLHNAGLLTKLDTRALEGYCVNYGRWVEAEEEIRRTGMVIRSPKGVPMLSPFVRVAREAHQAWSKVILEFGMTPSSRSRVTVTKPEKKDPFQLFLERGRLPRREDLE